MLTLPIEMIGTVPQAFISRTREFANVAAPDDVPFHVKSNERTNYFPYLALRCVVPLIRSSRGNACSPSLFGQKLGRRVHMRLVDGMSKVTARALDRRMKEMLQKEMEEITRDAYVISNRQTEKLIGINLGQFGYHV